MGQYTINGLLNGYKKNNKEREQFDYYATPTDEVINILDALGYDFSNQTIFINSGCLNKSIFTQTIIFN